MRPQAIVCSALLLGSVFAASAAKAEVIEVVTLKLKPVVTASAFKPIDKAVETEYVSKQPGFISRESAAGENGEWVVILHWNSSKDADASMAKFSGAPAASNFMSNIDAATLNMKRYDK